jgi:hypothetical protein
MRTRKKVGRRFVRIILGARYGLLGTNMEQVCRNGLLDFAFHYYDSKEKRRLLFS